MIYVIAIVGRYNRSKHTGFRVFSTDNMEYRDYDTKTFANAILRGVKVENVKVEDSKIKFDGYDLSKLPRVSKNLNDSYTRNMVNRILHVDEDGNYIGILFNGGVERLYEEDVIERILWGRIVNEGAYVPSVETVSKRRSIIESLERLGYTDIDVNEQCELVRATAKHNADIDILPQITKVRAGAINSSSGVFNTVRFRTRETREKYPGSNNASRRTYFRVSDLIESPFSRIRIKRLVFDCPTNIKGLSYEFDSFDIVVDELELDFKVRVERDNLTVIIKEFRGKLKDALTSGVTTIVVKESNKIDEDMEEELLNTFNTEYRLNQKVTDIKSLAAIAGIGGVMSPSQSEAIHCIEALKNLFSGDMADRLVKSIFENYYDIEDIINDNSINKYEKYGAVTIAQRYMDVLCARIGTNDEGRNVNKPVSHVTSTDCKRVMKPYKKYSETLDIRYVGTLCSHILVGINRNIKNDIKYCLIKLKK